MTRRKGEKSVYMYAQTFAWGTQLFFIIVTDGAS